MNMPAEYVNATNGRSYRAMPLTPQERDWLVKGTHYMRHQEHLSVRGIVAAFKKQYGVQVSRGAVHGYLVNYPCNQCQELRHETTGLTGRG